MSWNDVIGHSHLTGGFRRQILSDRLSHAYLFEGPAGVGKKRMALALAQAVNCERACAGKGADGGAIDGADPCGTCPACSGIPRLADAGLMVYRDVAEGRWVPRREALTWAGSEDLLFGAYAALLEGGFLNPPLPTGGGAERWDRLFPAPDKIVRRDVRRALDELAGLGGDEVSEAAGRVGTELFRLPRSLVYYRRSLGIDLVTPRARSETARTVQGFLSRKRLSGRRKVVILDDAHKMTEEAQNCLLKTLEEPPDHSLLILILDNAQEILPTIRSRCQSVKFGTLPPERIAETLEQRGFTQEEARWAAQRSGGRFSIALARRREEVLEAREEMLHTWDVVCGGDLSSVLGEAGRLAREDIADRNSRVRNTREQLDALLIWIRDLLLVALGAPRHLLVNGDLEEILGRESRRVAPAVLEAMFWTVARTCGQLNQNVDLRLALESMALALPTAGKNRDAIAG